MTDQSNIKDVIIKVFEEDLEKASRYHNSFETPIWNQSSLAASPSTYQCLYLWLAGTGGPRVSYDFQSFPKSYLFNVNDSSSVPPDPERPAEKLLDEEVNPSSDDGVWRCLGVGCAKLGSKIFFVGGQKPQKMEASASLALLSYSLHEYSSSVFVVDAARPFQQSQVPSMNSGKASPLVVSVGESLYVLAGTPVNMLPKPAFEKYSYDNKTLSWKWTNLPSPPFLDPSCKYFEDPQYCGYAVIKHMIHVSTSSSSFYFNTDTETWERSTLFGDTPAEDIRYPPPFEWMNYPVDNDGGKVGGAPFNFNGEAVLYGDDVLICIVLSKGVVAAHYLVDGRVERAQILEGLKIPTDAVSACLAYFGEGLLCLVSSFNPNQDLESFETEISITSFRVEGNVNKELNCDVLEKRTVTPQSNFKIWSVTSCFVHDDKSLDLPLIQASERKNTIYDMVRCEVDSCESDDEIWGVPRWTQEVQVCPGTGLEGPIDDGYSWRKYGQKDILGAKYPRRYYRCAQKHFQGCLATKTVQRSDDDPTIFKQIYQGRHTCTPAAVAAPPPPEEQEPSSTLDNPPLPPPPQQNQDSLTSSFEPSLNQI